MARPIEREPRGTRDYEAKITRLDAHDLLTLELVEESVLADVGRQHRRRTMPDGTTFDLTVYDEWNVLLSFRTLDSGLLEFVDFKFYEP